MKKIIILFTSIIILDAILFGWLFYELRVQHNLTLDKIRTERGELMEDKNLEKRGKELQKLFKKTKFPINVNLEFYVYSPNDSGEKYAGTTYKMNDSKIIVLIKTGLEERDDLILHELCHVALYVNGAENNHESSDWAYLVEYFNDIGYEIY